MTKSLGLILACLLRVKDFLVFKLILKLSLRLLKTKGLCHQLPYDSFIRLPLLLAFFLMMLEEVIIWLEHWKLVDGASGVRLANYEDCVSKNIQDVMGHIEVGAVVLEGDGLN